MSKKQSTNSYFFNHIAVFFRHGPVRSLGIIFMAHGLLVAAYFTRIPELKEIHHLTDAQLGRILLALPLGISLMNPNVGYLMERFGGTRTATVGFIFYAISMVTIFVMPNPWMLFFNLLIAGLFVGTFVVSVNTLVTRIEKSESIHVLSSCHGMFSLGAMLGAGLSSIMIALEIATIYQLATIGIVIVLLNFYNKKHLNKIPKTAAAAKGKLFAWPNKALWFLIAIGLTVGFAEGFGNDWAAVYMKDTIGATPQIGALAFGGFAMAMTVMRFSGDFLIPKLGTKKLLVIGACLIFIGLLIAVLIPTAITAIIGFIIVGFGVALGIPLLVNLAAKVEGFSDGAAVGIFTGIAGLGFVVEPMVIGWIADVFYLKVGLLFVAGLSLLGGLLALRLK